MITVGILVSYLVGYLLSQGEGWRWMLGLGALPGLVLFVGMLPLPESPRWLAGLGRTEEARERFACSAATRRRRRRNSHSFAATSRARRGPSGWPI